MDPHIVKWFIYLVHSKHSVYIGSSHRCRNENFLYQPKDLCADCTITKNIGQAALFTTDMILNKCRRSGSLLGSLAIYSYTPPPLAIPNLPICQPHTDLISSLTFCLSVYKVNYKSSPLFPYSGSPTFLFLLLYVCLRSCVRVTCIYACVARLYFSPLVLLDLPWQILPPGYLLYSIQILLWHELWKSL